MFVEEGLPDLDTKLCDKQAKLGKLLGWLLAEVVRSAAIVSGIQFADLIDILGANGNEGHLVLFVEFSILLEIRHFEQSTPLRESLKVCFVLEFRGEKSRELSA